MDLKGPVPLPTLVEQPLSGGNMTTGIVRIGDTVRRPAGPWTPAVHALLAHLVSAGFTSAPEPLGLDQQGREVLRYVPGTVPWGEEFGLLEPIARLARAARFIRGFHDAVQGFVPPAGATWQVLTATPSSRLWDLAWAVLTFIPLSANPRLQSPHAGARLRAFADAYGLDDEDDRRRLLALLGRRARSMQTFLACQSARNVEPWATLWRDGHGAAWGRDADYVEANSGPWHTALLG